MELNISTETRKHSYTKAQNNSTPKAHRNIKASLKSSITPRTLKSKKVAREKMEKFISEKKARLELAFKNTISSIEKRCLDYLGTFTKEELEVTVSEAISSFPEIEEEIVLFKTRVNK
ncbi:hypothetical protein DSO57_1036178 [Entomophthora muscae]|uniref:Uncharacterized protein n=1 Tax=Entomophthora muscae TaxID=34485 RepID=A0ACC2SCB3_9FUNG|nr:hypothetical protein DSO57_1036178 [Entomophthora muscae]